VRDRAGTIGAYAWSAADSAELFIPLQWRKRGLTCIALTMDMDSLRRLVDVFKAAITVPRLTVALTSSSSVVSSTDGSDDGGAGVTRAGTKRTRDPDADDAERPAKRTRGEKAV